MTTTTISPQDTPDTQPGPRKPKHSRRFRVLRAIGIGFTALVVASAALGALEGPQKPAAIPAASTSSPAARVTSAAPRITRKPAAKPAPKVTRTTAPAAAPAVPAVSAMADWCSGPGWADLQTVEQDNALMGDDATAGDPADTEAQGGALMLAAETASENPPPLTAARAEDYRLAMAWMAVAGSDASQGDWGTSATALSTATGYFNDDAGTLSCPS
jgi:hypothetical protein